MMLLGNLVQAVGMAAYLWADSLLAVALWTTLLNIGRQSFWGSFGNVVTAISAPGERELWFGFLQAVRNLGYSVGGVLAGVALQVGTDLAFQSVVVVNAVTFVLAFVLLLDVPDHRVAHGLPTHPSRAGAWSCATGPTCAWSSASSASSPG